MKIRPGMPVPKACVNRKNSFLKKHRIGYTQLALIVTALAGSITSGFAQNDDDYTPSNLGPFEVQLRTDNPLREPFRFYYRPAPTAIDLDGDGDTDVIVADYDGGNGFDFLRNDGTSTAPAFNKAMYLANPFGYTSFDDGGTTSFADVDTDGDLDMLFGTIDGTFRFYKRTSPTGLAWTIQSSAWNPETKSGNPLFGIDLGDFTSPVFNDMDNDGDLDLLIGSSYLPSDKSIHYYVNDGEFNFTPSAVTGINPIAEEVTPTFLDVDNDGYEDVIAGAADGNLYYFKRTGVTSFEEQTGLNNPLAFFNRGQYSSPCAADFDNDGDKDLIVGFVDGLVNFAYLENKGNGVFEEKTGFDNPFGGATVMSDAAPVFADIDGDNDEDMLLGSSDNDDPYLKYFKNENGKYTEVIANNPFSGTTVPNMFVPSFVDLDGDGDKDLVATADNGDMSYVEYFKNESGNFVKQTIAGGPFDQIYWNEGRGVFADIDNDGDFDLIASDRIWESGDDRYFIRYFENTGNATNPLFNEQSGALNPFDAVSEDFELLPRFADIDHDGDQDLLIGEGGSVIENQDGNEVHFYENMSTASGPVFKYRGNITEQGRNPFEPMPAFTDHDGDGDLDIFYGTISGSLVYYKNINPAATLSINTAPLMPQPGSTAMIDPLLTLTDADNDSIVFAQVSISGFIAGQVELSFTPVSGINGAYNASTGILTCSGKAPLATYQLLLRSVAITQLVAPTNGRLKNPSVSLSTLSKSVSFNVTDADGTISPAVTRVVNFVSASAPVFADHAVSATAGSIVTIDLKPLITDPNNDIDLNTITITQAPAQGNAAVDASGVLTVDFSAGNFGGSVTIGLSVCDAAGACDAATITVNVTNATPAFDDATVTINAGAIGTIDLKDLISDSDNNVDYGTITIVEHPGSGAPASIDANQNLIINYQHLAFTGSETTRLRVCDLAGACATSVLSLNINNTAPVFGGTSVTIPYHGTATVNLASLITDAESNLVNTTLTIVNGSAAGAHATLTGNQLTVNYGVVSFAGTDNLQLSICDIAGACATGNVTIIVQNAPPVIQTEPVSTAQGTSKTLNLLAMTSDADGNLDLSTFVITQAPVSGAAAKIEVISGEVLLTVDYSGVMFYGNDQLTIRACDEAGACTENTISIEVSSEVQIYNAVAPNSPGDNKFLRILNLPADNKVTIFNRWGDVVYRAEHYDNDAVKFEGIGDNGAALTSATYFYKLEYYDQSGSLKTITGYLSLKQ